MASPERSVSERGFTTYEFRDSYSNQIAIRESSAASAPHVWIFITDDRGDGRTQGAHLTVEQAGRVRDALSAYLQEQEADSG